MNVVCCSVVKLDTKEDHPSVSSTLNQFITKTNILIKMLSISSSRELQP